VTKGANQTFTITPNSGYVINSITVDGVPQTLNATLIDQGTVSGMTRIRGMGYSSLYTTVIAVGDLILRSINGGHTPPAWTGQYPAPPSTILSVVHAGNNGGFNTWVAGGTGQIYRSTNDGSTWTNLGVQFSQDHIYALTSLGGGILIAGTESNGYILQSTDYGATWAQANASTGETQFAGGACSLGGTSVLLGAGTTGDIWISRNNGNSGSWVNKGNPLPSVMTDIDHCTYLGNNTAILSTYHATAGGHIIRSTNTNASTPTWTDMGKFDSFAVEGCATNGSGIVLCGGLQGGHTYRSADYGATWQDLGLLESETTSFVGAFNTDTNAFFIGTYPNGKIIRLDHVGYGTTGSYTFSNVQANHTITATFIPDPLAAAPVAHGWRH
jgi:photosystem II stability/assembly factor-like uncharacterized protein